MKRRNYFVILSLVATVTIAGCGMPGPLYEEAEKPTTPAKDNNSKG